MAWQSGKLGAETAGVRGDWRTPGAARGAVRCGAAGAGASNRNRQAGRG